MEEELKQELIEPKDKDVTDKIEQLNIAQLIPAHIRPEFAATVASSVRVNLQQGGSPMTYTQVHNVTRDIQDLLRKPQRVMVGHPTPRAAEQENHPDEDEEAKQTRIINKILNKAITYIRNGQQREAIRELAKEELQPASSELEDDARDPRHGG